MRLKLHKMHLWLHLLHLFLNELEFKFCEQEFLTIRCCHQFLHVSLQASRNLVFL